MTRQKKKQSERLPKRQHGLMVGDKAPYFDEYAVVKKKVTKISLDQYKGNTYLVLMFYPADL